MNKAYNLKVYTLEGIYKDTINNDIIMSDISFSSQINEGQGELRIQLNLPFTDSTIQKTDLIKVFEFDENNLSGVQIYTGIVGRISRISEKNGEYIELSAIGLSSILSLVMYDEAGNYILTKNQETSDTIKDILDNIGTKYPGIITYTTDSIETTAITSNLSFSYTKALEAIQTTAGVTEYTWYIDAFGLFQFHPKTGAIEQRTHKVTIGKDIESITVEEDSEKVVNKYILEYSGGSTVTNSDATSIATYGLKEIKETNTSILDFTTAGTAVATFLQQNKDEKKKTRVVVNSLYNIESIRPGDLLTVKNFEYQIEALQIVRTEYNPEQITIELEEYDSFSKEIFNQ